VFVCVVCGCVVCVCVRHCAVCCVHVRVSSNTHNLFWNSRFPLQHDAPPPRPSVPRLARPAAPFSCSVSTYWFCPQNVARMRTSTMLLRTNWWTLSTAYAHTRTHTAQHNTHHSWVSFLVPSRGKGSPTAATPERAPCQNGLVSCMHIFCLRCTTSPPRGRNLAIWVSESLHLRS
jgi:hypothetical protein